jgi:hypothetical protein
VRSNAPGRVPPVQRNSSVRCESPHSGAYRSGLGEPCGPILGSISSYQDDAGTAVSVDVLFLLLSAPILNDPDSGFFLQGSGPPNLIADARFSQRLRVPLERCVNESSDAEIDIGVARVDDGPQSVAA